MGFDEDTLDWLHSCLEDGFHTMRDVVGFLEDYDTAKALEVSEQYDQNTNVLVIESKSWKNLLPCPEPGSRMVSRMKTITNRMGMSDQLRNIKQQLAILKKTLEDLSELQELAEEIREEESLEAAVSGLTIYYLDLKEKKERLERRLAEYIPL